MAILQLISSNQVNESFQYLNDVIGVYEDDHPFTQNELDRFSFLTVNGSRADVRARLDQIRPVEAEAYYNGVEWSFVEMGTTTDTKIVWASGNRWYNLVSPFKFPFNVGELTAEEKQLLETLDINHPSVDAAVNKIIKDLVAANPDNGVEEKDLRNQIP